MKKYPMFMFRKTQYSSDVSFSQLDLQIQCIPNKILVSYMVNTKKLVLKITQRGKKFRTVNIMSKAKNKAGGLILPL